MELLISMWAFSYGQQVGKDGVMMNSKVSNGVLFCFLCFFYLSIYIFLYSILVACN